MKKSISLIILLANLISLINGEFVCNELEPIKDFQREKFMGIWYETMKNPSIFDAALKCVVGNMSSLSPDTIVSNVRAESLYSDKTVEFKSYLKHPVDSTIGQFKVHVIETGIEGYFTIGIIDIDYDSYAIYHGCDHDNEIEYAWVSSRKQIVTAEEIEHFKKVFEENGVNTKYVVIITQDNCKN